MVFSEKCALAAASALLPHLRGSRELDAYVSNFSEPVNSEFKRLDDLALAATFREHCSVEGATDGDYCNKVILCPSGAEVIAGIRFRGLDLNKPFVALLAQTEAHLTYDDFDFIKNEVALKFEVFCPRWLRAFIPHGYPICARLFPVEYAGKALVAAPIEVVAHGSTNADEELTFEESTDELELVPAQDTSFYSQYLDAYASAHTLFPPSRVWSPVETEDDLAELIKSQTLYEIFINGTWAGIFGGKFTALHGLKGFYIAEIILAPNFRVKQFARRVHQRAAQILISGGADGKDWFYGTIGQANTPALKTALSAGRKILGIEYWLPI